MLCPQGVVSGRYPPVLSVPEALGRLIRWDVHMRVVSVVRRLGGAARRKELVQRGITDHEIARARQAGLIKRPLRGVLALPDLPQDLALACYFNARLSCLTAADHHGIRILKRPAVPHLELDIDRGGHKDASFPHQLCHLHRSRTHEPYDRVVSAARAIDMAANCVAPLEQLVMLDHALALRKVDWFQIAEFVNTPLPARRWLASEANQFSGSVSETCARVALRSAGLDLHVQAPLGDGRFGDLLVNGCLFVEVDGYEFHSNPKQFAEDRARDRYLTAQGFRVLRFTYADAVYYPKKLVADVLAALAAPIKRPA